MLIALHRGTGFIAKCIQWQTRSPYSHASIVFSPLKPDSRMRGIEAREFKGVRRVDWQSEYEGTAYDLFAVAGLTREQEDAVAIFCGDQVGKPYDYTMVARFISRRQLARETSGKWFCSELVYYAFMQAGINLLDRIEPWAVSPGLLALSPLLIPVSRDGSEGDMEHNAPHLANSGGSHPNALPPSFNPETNTQANN